MGLKFVAILSTTPSAKEAAKIAKALVSKRLVACVNIVPNIRSIYYWKGKLCDDREFMLVMKTRRSRVKGVKHALKKLHSYECPELVVLPIVDGLPKYLEWVTNSVKFKPQTSNLKLQNSNFKINTNNQIPKS